MELTAQFAYPFSRGAGLTLGQGVGGYIRGGDKYLATFGAVLQDDSYPSAVEFWFTSRPDVRAAWEVFVNSDGHRFMREDHPSVHYREHRLTAQAGQRAWVIADQAIMDKAPIAYEGWDKKKLIDVFDHHPMFATADTLDALAVKTGINPVNLAATIANYNRSIEEGTTDAFGREHRPLPVSKGPYYAVRMTGMSLLSFAGLAVDSELRVIRPNGSPVPNLYAAGEVIGAGATSGNSYCNGSMVTPAITFGRLLGQRMLNFSA
jgi:fumarate reductase flavoprotein subunit